MGGDFLLIIHANSIQIAYLWYPDKREYPTLTMIHEEAKKRGVFSAGRFCLWRCLKDMGFLYKEHDS